MTRSQGCVTTPAACAMSAWALALALAACGGSSEQAALSVGDGGDGGDDTGSINAEFLLPSGTASTASYILTGPNDFHQTSTLDFDGSQAIGFLIDSVPAGAGYTLSFTASNGDGGEACSGSTSVDVTAQHTTPVNVTAQCTGAPYVPTGYGGLDIWTTLPTGVSFAGLEYVLMGPAGIEAHDAVVVNTSGIHFTLQAIPAGTGQTITLTAPSTDGSETCSATSTFDIVANQTSEAMLTMVCQKTASGDQ